MLHSTLTMFSMPSLPKEIEEEIFLKLPLKSIGISRCVCKVWCSQLSNPKFNRLHLNHTIKPRFIVRKKDSWRSMICSVDDCSINSSAASEKSPKVVYSEDVRRAFPFAYNKQLRYSYMEIIGSCNGFFCFSISYSRFWGDNENTICVWNPSTGEYKTIPQAELLNHKTDQIGFGYDSNIHDYQVVKVRDCKIRRSSSGDVYTLRSNLWESVRQENYYVFPFGERESGFIFNGALHWKGFRRTLNRVIVYYDINNKKLADFPFPELDFPLKKIERERSGALYDNLDTSVGVLGGRLCLAIDVGKSRTDIWVMREYGVNDSWTKLFSTLIYCSFTRPSLHLDNCEILMDTKVGLVMFDKKYERWRDLKVNTETVHALLLWGSSDTERAAEQ